MRLGVKPAVFLLRLLAWFALVYVVWALTPLATIYTQLLASLTNAAIRMTEWFGDANVRGGTTVFARGEGIYFAHRLFPNAEPPGIPGDWVQANLVLLIPLMLATPAATWALRLRRLAIALACAVALQVFGLVVTIKAAWSTELGEFSFRYFSRSDRFIYSFLDAFCQSFDTQLFPFAIWAGIHFRQLTGRSEPAAPPPQSSSTKPRAKSRHKAKAAARAARSS